MIFNILVLFLAALLGGLAFFIVPAYKPKHFQMILAFSGAYLFSVTVIHILPELFIEADIERAGLFVVAGFFLQLILEYFSSGVEHGHIHIHEEKAGIVPYSLLIALGIHAFLEGTLLYHPAHNEALHGHSGDYHSLLLGLVLHKIPAAFALTSVLMNSKVGKNKALAYLFIFSLASPAGLWLSKVFFTSTLLEADAFMVIFALVAGNFLYISTTIFFETSPEHKFRPWRLLLALAGAASAAVVELYL